MEKEIFTINDPIDEAGHRFMEVRNTGIPKFKKLDNWLKKEANIFWNEKSKAKSYQKYEKGQIVKVDFGINIGSEFCHTHYAIVINNDDTTINDNITVIPISSKSGYRRVYLGKILKNFIKSKKYNKDSYAVITQTKTISKTRIFTENHIYICNQETQNKLNNSILDYLGIDNNKIM